MKLWGQSSFCCKYGRNTWPVREGEFDTWLLLCRCRLGCCHVFWTSYQDDEWLSLIVLWPLSILHMVALMWPEWTSTTQVARSEQSAHQHTYLPDIFRGTASKHEAGDGQWKMFWGLGLALLGQIGFDFWSYILELLSNRDVPYVPGALPGHQGLRSHQGGSACGGLPAGH